MAQDITDQVEQHETPAGDDIEDVVRDQDVSPDNISPEKRRELDHEIGQHDEHIPRPSDDGDADADLDERDMAHDEHDNR